jgi:hypothetical protein
MRSLRRLFLLIAWLLLALPGLLALAPAGWPGIAWARQLLAAPRLFGEAQAPPLPDGNLLRSWQDGTLRAAVAARLPSALVGRALAVRAFNQLYYDLFRRSHGGQAEILIGGAGTLFSQPYVRAYCRPLEPDRAAWMQEMTPRVAAVAAALRRRGGALVVVVSPSKPHVRSADLPVARCQHDPAQERLREVFVAALRSASVPVLDGAALAQAAEATDPLPAFPRGGVHWSLLLQWRADRLVLGLLAGESGLALGSLELQAVDWQARPADSDADLANLLNLLRPPLDYLVGQADVRCVAQPEGAGRPLLAAGTSFGLGLARRLATCGLFQQVLFFNRYDTWQRVLNGDGTLGATLYPTPRASPEVWRARLQDRPLMMIEVQETALYTGDLYFDRLVADLAVALGL